MWIWVTASATLVFYLVISSVRGTEVRYVNAAELSGLQSQYVRVAGRVAAGGIQAEGPGDVSISFLLIDERGDTAYVEYTGVRPDAFREGAQAVVEGAYDSGRRIFHAELLQAKCPSKYEVGVPAASVAKT